MKKPKVRIKKAESFGEGRYVIVSDKDKSFPLFWGDKEECLACVDSFYWEFIENNTPKDQSLKQIVDERLRRYHKIICELKIDFGI